MAIPRAEDSGTTAAAVVRHYLDALGAHDWDALAATLATDVVRRGPYGDDHHGRADYVAFLAGLVPTLPGYVLHVQRVAAAGRAVTVELDETIDDGDGRLRTDEAIVFDVDDTGHITRVAVYLRSSQRIEV